tara:strand:+ start:45 stop:197 length:153 start_codon:yes stop_codon:yes gene_type:complete
VNTNIVFIKNNNEGRKKMNERSLWELKKKELILMILNLRKEERWLKQMER